MLLMLVGPSTCGWFMNCGPNVGTAKVYPFSCKGCAPQLATAADNFVSLCL